MKRKIKPVWTCSDYVYHEHKYKLTAWLCGRIQYFKYLIINMFKINNL